MDNKTTTTNLQRRMIAILLITIAGIIIILTFSSQLEKKTVDSSNDVRRRRRLQGVMGNLQHGGGGSRFVLDPKTVELKQDTVYIPPPTNDNEKEEEEMTLHHPLLHLHHQQLQQAQQLLHQQQQQLAQLQLNSSVSPPGLTNVNEQQQQQSQLLPQPLEQPPLQPQLDHQPQQQQQQQQFVQKPEEISQQVQNNNVNNFATPNEVQQQQQSQQQLIEQQSLQQQFNEPQQQQQQQFIPPEIMQQEQPMIQNQNDDINNINLANNNPRNNEVQQQSQQQQLLLDQQQQASPQHQQQEFVVHQTRQEIVPSSQQQQQQQQQLLVQQPHIQQEPIQDNLNNNFLVIPNNNIVQSNHLVPQELNPQLPQSVEPVVPSSSTEKLETVANSLIITPPPTTIQPYNIYNILETLKAFRYQGFFFIYDSTTNEFVIIHATPTCDLGCVRIYRIASILAYALRKNFPERFPLSSSPSDQVNDVATFGSGGSGGGRTASNNNNNNSNGDLVFVISTGDVPRIHHYCLSPSTNYCSSTNFGPILQFGSIFVNSDYMPSMIAMPQPVRPHMPCFDEWQLHGRVCNDLQPAQVTPTVGGDPRGNSGGEEFRGIASFAGGLVFGQELGLISKPTYWNDLIPQIIWRGTDFVFLHTMFPKMRRPNFARDIAPKESITRNGGENKRWAIDALWGMGEMLQPRWRGVLLTSEAELEADEFREGGDFTLPWVNIKFASCNVKRKKVDASQNPEFVKMESVGIKAIGERVNMQEQAKYRYHIDLGGGGGTSWTGTIEKLALPGVLFHHVTPTKDWFYDRLQPWVHYIPVDSDLTDLREKFEWAESHPEEAQKIAEAGTEFARWIGTPEGFGELYQQHLVAPLEGIINAYQPSPDASDVGKSVLDVIREKGSPDYTIVSRCSGSHQYSCKDLDGKIPSGAAP